MDEPLDLLLQVMEARAYVYAMGQHARLQEDENLDIEVTPLIELVAAIEDELGAEAALPLLRRPQIGAEAVAPISPHHRAQTDDSDRDLVESAHGSDRGPRPMGDHLARAVTK